MFPESLCADCLFFYSKLAGKVGIRERTCSGFHQVKPLHCFKRFDCVHFLIVDFLKIIGKYRLTGK